MPGKSKVRESGENTNKLNTYLNEVAVTIFHLGFELKQVNRSNLPDPNDIQSLRSQIQKHGREMDAIHKMLKNPRAHAEDIQKYIEQKHKLYENPDLATSDNNVVREIAGIVKRINDATDLDTTVGMSTKPR